MMGKKSKSIPPKVPAAHTNDTEKVEATLVFSEVSKRNRWLAIGAIALLVGIIVILGYHNSSIESELASTTKAKQKAAESIENFKKDLQKMNDARIADKTKYEEAQQALEEQIAGLEAALQNVKSRVGDLKDEKQKALREANQFKRFSKQFQRMINSGKLEVVFRNGRMVVNLPAQVLFDSGSAELTEDGLKALSEVAKILRRVKNKRFVVGGHTDNQKIRKSSFVSNWELASARAIVVTKTLIKAGLSPKNLIAAGYSQYAPIASNRTDVGRQKNRRIEIILEPFLKKIPLPRKKNRETARKNKSTSKKTRETARKTRLETKKSKSTARNSVRTPNRFSRGRVSLRQLHGAEIAGGRVSCFAPLVDRFAVGPGLQNGTFG